MNNLRLFVTILTLLAHRAVAQDPAQPAMNLGLTGTLDGDPPSTGLFYFNYFQYYHADALYNSTGSQIADVKLNVAVWMHQLTYISKAKALGGNVGVSALFPLVFMNAEGVLGLTPEGETIELTHNDDWTGDLIVSPFVQWFDRRLFGKKFSHRLELSVVAPVGAYRKEYVVNPGANVWSFQPFYAFTLYLTDKLSVSQRHHLTYHRENPSNRQRSGQLYHGVYSVEFQVIPRFWLSGQGYYLRQLTPDRLSGDKFPFDTKERVLGMGPSVSYVTKSGIFLEAKVLFEAMAKNRPQGFRTGVRVVYKIR